MKRWAAAAALLLMGCSTEPQTAPVADAGAVAKEETALPQTILAADAGKTIRAAVGESFSIKLETIPTAGYIWRLDGELPGFLELAGEDTLPTTPEQSQPGFVGGNHWMVFTYRVVKPGNATLTLVEGRPWETGEKPSDTFRIAIEGRAKASVD